MAMLSMTGAHKHKKQAKKEDGLFLPSQETVFVFFDCCIFFVVKTVAIRATEQAVARVPFGICSSERYRLHDKPHTPPQRLTSAKGERKLEW